jgi:acetyl/propionyl-CoA carboxylase alpha subunit
MIRALDTYQICGLTHNVNFLRDVLTNPRFIAGRLSTAFIKARRKQRLIRLTWSELHLAPCIHCLQEEFPEGYKGHQLTPVESQQVNTHTHPLSLSKTKKKKITTRYQCSHIFSSRASPLCWLLSVKASPIRSEAS